MSALDPAGSDRPVAPPPSSPSDRSGEATRRQGSGEDAPSSPRLDGPPTELGPFVLQRLIGEGAQASVFLANQVSLDRPVALKVLSPWFASDAELTERLHAEARLAARLRHANVVNVYDSGCDAGWHWIALEYVDGESLSSVIEADAPLEEARALQIALALARGLAAAAEHGILHCDVKPDNVLIAGDGTPKVADLGVAQDALGLEDSSEENLVVGTPNYMSPEQASGADLDPRSDIYSLGIVLYEMLTGEVPLTSTGPVETMMRHVDEDVPSPSSVRPTVSRRADMLLRAMTARDRDQRYPDATKLAADIEAVLAGKAPAFAVSQSLGRVRRSSGSGTARRAEAGVASAAPPPLPRATPEGGRVDGQTEWLPPASGSRRVRRPRSTDRPAGAAGRPEAARSRSGRRIALIALATAVGTIFATVGGVLLTRPFELSLLGGSPPSAEGVARRMAGSDPERETIFSGRLADVAAAARERLEAGDAEGALAAYRELVVGSELDLLARSLRTGDDEVRREIWGLCALDRASMGDADGARSALDRLDMAIETIAGQEAPEAEREPRARRAELARRLREVTVLVTSIVDAAASGSPGQARRLLDPEHWSVEKREQRKQPGQGPKKQPKESRGDLRAASLDLLDENVVVALRAICNARAVLAAVLRGEPDPSMEGVEEARLGRLLDEPERAHRIVGQRAALARAAAQNAAPEIAARTEKTLERFEKQAQVLAWTDEVGLLLDDGAAAWALRAEPARFWRWGEEGLVHDPDAEATPAEDASESEPASSASSAFRAFVSATTFSSREVRLGVHAPDRFATIQLEVRVPREGPAFAMGVLGPQGESSIAHLVVRGTEAKIAPGAIPSAFFDEVAEAAAEASATRTLAVALSVELGEDGADEEARLLVTVDGEPLAVPLAAGKAARGARLSLFLVPRAALTRARFTGRPVREVQPPAPR